ncbi:MAG: hypothetical protein J6J24_02480 [Clostridia bacterium]|nr:hypothetical protein [Clostridia bacterium]
MYYQNMHDFSLFVEYETVTYNVFYMRHNFSHGNCGEMTEEQFKKLDRENMRSVLPSYNEIVKRVGEENFKDWYRHQKTFWNKLDGNKYDQFCKIEKKSREQGEGSGNQELVRFLKKEGYIDFVPAKLPENTEKTKS